MKTSESITKIAPALLHAQSNITFAGKNAKNPHFKNTYADLPAVIDAVKEALNNAGIIFLQTPSPSEDGRLHLCTRLIHESGEWIEDTAVCPLPKSDPQGFGSALTYLRRYCLASICGLYQEDDDGEKAKVDVNLLNKCIMSINEADDHETLKNVYISAVRNFSSAPKIGSVDANALKALEVAKDKRKQELQNA
jgi:hypothetical protein